MDEQWKFKNLTQPQRRPIYCCECFPHAPQQTAQSVRPQWRAHKHAPDLAGSTTTRTQRSQKGLKVGEAKQMFEFV